MYSFSGVKMFTSEEEEEMEVEEEEEMEEEVTVTQKKRKAEDISENTEMFDDKEEKPVKKQDVAYGNFINYGAYALAFAAFLLAAA